MQVWDGLSSLSLFALWLSTLGAPQGMSFCSLQNSRHALLSVLGESATVVSGSLISVDAREMEHAMDDDSHVPTGNLRLAKPSIFALAVLFASCVSVLACDRKTNQKDVENAAEFDEKEVQASGSTGAVKIADSGHERTIQEDAPEPTSKSPDGDTKHVASSDARPPSDDWIPNEHDYEVGTFQSHGQRVDVIRGEACKMPEERAQAAKATAAFSKFLGTLKEVEHHPNTRFGDRMYENLSEFTFRYMTAGLRDDEIEKASKDGKFLGMCAGLESILHSMAISDKNVSWLADVYQLTYRTTARAKQVATIGGGFGKHPTWSVRQGRHIYVVEGRARAPHPNQAVADHLEAVVHGESG